MWWEQALLRPSHTADGRGKFFEGTAQDRGYLYQAARKVYALITSDDRDESFDVEAAWMNGKCNMTFSADLGIGPQDRITFLDMPVRTSEEVERGSGASDALVSRLGATEVLAIVGADNTLYRAGFDYQLTYNANKTIASIVWGGADAPTAGDPYAVHLNVRPQWIVKDHPKIRSFGAGKRGQLPKKVTLIADDQRVRQ